MLRPLVKASILEQAGYTLAYIQVKERVHKSLHNPIPERVTAASTKRTSVLYYNAR